MFAWDILNIYCRQDPRWFESVERYLPVDTHLAVFRELMPANWGLRRRGLWFIADPPARKRPDHGWKLHVSTRAADSAQVLRAAIPVLRDAGTEFKFLVDPWAVAVTNGKMWPRGSSGKFITIYPADDDFFRRIADDLTRELDGFEGPYILSDRRCPASNAVYYRYGGFTGVSRIRSDGLPNLMIRSPEGELYPDLRPAYWYTPPWVSQDPYGRAVAQDDDPDDDGAGETLLGDRFQVEEALQFSNRGGVYRGIDTVTDQGVILKEARPHVGVGKLKPDVNYIDILRKEHRLLSLLADTGRFVRPVALFTDWEHTFLAEEQVKGAQFSQVSIVSNPIVTLDLDPASLAAYYERMRGLFGQFVATLDAAHRHDVVLGDISWTNVLVEDETERLVVIDLEAAVQTSMDADLGIYTPGVSSPRSIATGRCTPADDYYALGRILFGSIMLVNLFIGYQPGALTRFLDELARDLGLPGDLVALVRDLNQDPDGTPPDPLVVGKRFEELSVGEVSAWPQVIPLATPASEQIVGERADALRRNVESTVEAVVEYLHATATPHRDDRLFPADVGVYETNPLSVAYGACGVLHALSRLPGDVPGHLTGWALRQGISGTAYPAGLYVGMSGIGWVLGELGHVEYAAALLRRARKHPLWDERAGVLWGSAGQGMACLRLWQLTGGQEFLDDAVRIGEQLARTAQQDDLGAYWTLPAAEGEPTRVPLGYAHGPAGVSLFLLYLHLAAGDGDALALGRRALDFELAHAIRLTDRVTGFRGDVDETRDPACRCYWDVGTAGVLTSVVRYVAATGDDALRAWVDRLLPDVSRKYAVLPQLFHGLAGLGNVLIDVAELLGRADAMAEAWRTAEGVLLFRIKRPEGIVFPGEQALRESGDFGTGSAGVGLFLHRLTTGGPGHRTNFNFVLDDLLTPPSDTSV